MRWCVAKPSCAICAVVGRGRGGVPIGQVLWLTLARHSYWLDRTTGLLPSQKRGAVHA